MMCAEINIPGTYKKSEADDCLGGYTSLVYLKRCEGYNAAKENGDIVAADSIIKKCVSADNLRSIKAKYPDSFLLPVMKQNNMLPLALCANIGLPVCSSVQCSASRRRKNLPAIQRILCKPVFSGVIAPGKNYILVDDIVTQGGTMSSLMRFVSSEGGNVRAVLSLVYGRGSRRIAPAKEKLAKLKRRFGNKLTDFFEDYGMGSGYIDQLTNSEILYLLKFSSVENMRKKAGEASGVLALINKSDLADSLIKI